MLRGVSSSGFSIIIIKCEVVIDVQMVPDFKKRKNFPEEMVSLKDKITSH